MVLVIQKHPLLIWTTTQLPIFGPKAQVRIVCAECFLIHTITNNLINGCEAHMGKLLQMEGNGGAQISSSNFQLQVSKVAKKNHIKTKT